MKTSRITMWVIVAAAACLTLATAPAAGEGEVRIDEIRVGFDNYYRPGHMVPVFVKLTNTAAEPFDGELRAVTADDDGDRLRWRYKAPLAGNDTTERHLVICPTPTALVDGDVTVSIGSTVGGRYRPLASVTLGAANDASRAAMPTLPTAIIDGERVVGVIGSNYSRLGVLNTAERFTNEPVRVVLVRPREIPSMWQGLDMIDVLYWDDPDPAGANLSADQQRALVQWVRRGGHLIVGLGPKAHMLASRGSVLDEILPVVVERTGVQVRNYNDLRRAFGIIGPVSGGPAVQCTPKPGSCVRARTADTHLPLLTRWASGAGSVTVMSTTLGSVIDDRVDPGARAKFAARLVGLTTRSQPIRTMYGATAVTGGMSSHLDSAGVGGLIVALVILMCLLYAVIAGPGSWLYLRLTKRMHLSWWVFGAVVLVATLASVTLSLFGIRGKSISTALVLDLNAGSNYGVARGYFGLYVPAHGSPELVVDGDMHASVTPMIDPQPTELFGGYPDEQSYDLNLAEPTRLSPPIRRTIKRFALTWQGDVGHTVTAAMKVLPSVKGKTVAGVTGSITNELPVDLTDAVLLYSIATRPGAIFVAKVGDLDSGEVVRLTTGAAVSGERECPTQALAAFHDRLVSRLGLMSMISGGRRDFLTQVQMLSTMARYQQPGSNSPANVAPIIRHSLARLDRCDQIHPGQALLIARSEGYLPVPIRVDGDSVESTGPVIVRVLIPVASRLPPPAAGGPAATTTPGVNPNE